MEQKLKPAAGVYEFYDMMIFYECFLFSLNYITFDKSGEVDIQARNTRADALESYLITHVAPITDFVIRFVFFMLTGVKMVPKTKTLVFLRMLRYETFLRVLFIFAQLHKF